MVEIPSYLINSMTVASISFFLAIWLLVQIFYKKVSVSLVILAGLIIWYCLVYILGRVGFWAQNPMYFPFIIFGFVVLYFILKFIYRLPVLQAVADSIPVHFLVGIQVFRFMGIGFLTFYGLGLIPGEFALPTGWGDVLVGTTAIPVAFLLYIKKGFARKLAIYWNYLGIADLVLALFLGNVTFPRPFQMLPTTPDNLLIAVSPLVMVPLFAVPLSLILHFFTLKILKNKT